MPPCGSVPSSTVTEGSSRWCVSGTQQNWRDLIKPLLSSVGGARREGGSMWGGKEKRGICVAEAADDYRLSMTFAAKWADTRPIFFAPRLGDKKKKVSSSCRYVSRCHDKTTAAGNHAVNRFQGVYSLNAQTVRARHLIARPPCMYWVAHASVFSATKVLSALQLKEVVTQSFEAEITKEKFSRRYFKPILIFACTRKLRTAALIGINMTR